MLATTEEGPCPFGGEGCVCEGEEEQCDKSIRDKLFKDPAFTKLCLSCQHQVLMRSLCAPHGQALSVACYCEEEASIDTDANPHSQTTTNNSCNDKAVRCAPWAYHLIPTSWKGGKVGTARQPLWCGTSTIGRAQCIKHAVDAKCVSRSHLSVEVVDDQLCKITALGGGFRLHVELQGGSLTLPGSETLVSGNCVIHLIDSRRTTVCRILLLNK